jgi:leader peptidase (prepilin peptidase)/N-methyltransferase
MLKFPVYFLLGLCGAWLVNYLSDVMPQFRKLVPLRCRSCSEPLDWQAYLVYSPCANCGGKIPRRHLVLLLTLPFLSLLVGIYPINSLGPYGSILWLVYFSLVVVIDLEHRLILHPISLVGGVLAALFGAGSHGIANTLLGGAAGFGIMLAFYFLGEGFVRILARRRGEEIQEVALGFGDVNLAGIMGLLLGWPGVVGGIFLAVLLGGIVSGIFLIVQLVQKKYQAFQALPYGPFLVASVFLLFYISQFVR